MGYATQQWHMNRSSHSGFGRNAFLAQNLIFKACFNEWPQHKANDHRPIFTSDQKLGGLQGRQQIYDFTDFHVN